MTLTSTPQATTMTQNYDLSGAFLTLQKGGIILMPTDTLWSVACSAAHPEAIERLQRLVKLGNTPHHGLELIVHSMNMLKSQVIHLHPRLETLLVFHTRPLSMLMEAANHLPDILKDEEGHVAVRLAHDDFCIQLIGALGSPLVVAPACIDGQPFPAHFGAISSEIIEGVDHVSKYRQHERNGGEPAVMVKLMEEEEELIFLRE